MDKTFFSSFFDDQERGGKKGEKGRKNQHLKIVRQGRKKD